MLSTILAFAYPGECARLMVAHPGIEIYAPIVALVSLACVWALVWLIFRSKFAATASAVVLFCMPAFRLGLMHPLKHNFYLGCALLGLVVVVGAYRLWRGWRLKDENDTRAVSRMIVFLGLSLFAVASLSFLNRISVYVCALAAIVAGISISHWWHDRGNSLISKISFWLLSFVFAFTCVFELCVADWSEGSFADRMAEEIIADMGDRDWIVTDGALDDHLKLVAKAKGRDINVISLAKDDDADYRKSVAELVREKNLAGDACEDLAFSLDLGVLQFVQDWLKADPEVAKKCVIFGAPDLWYSAGLKPVPEMFFFGGDPARTPDWSRWKAFDELLAAPKGWGSYHLWKVEDPVEKLRLNLRRHLGLVANNRGVWLQDAGKDDEAFEKYRLVYTDIDRDNVSTMFNLLAMASAKYAPAMNLRKDIDEKFKKIIADKNRRYILGALSRFYGYIRDPQMFVRLGFQWARSGMPGTAMAQIRRAMDLVPTDRRGSLVNMLAALYASDNDIVKSRQTYEEVLAADSENHEALVGMMRLALMDGNQKLALEYLERAVAAGGDDPRIDVEKAMLAMMKNDLKSASAILHHCVDLDAKNLSAWSLLSSVLMQQCDAEQDPEKREALEKELEGIVLPAMEAGAENVNDYYVNSVRGFLLLRKGPDRRREARDAFAVAAKMRPDVATTQDIVLGLDIQLDDRENAAIHARDALKVNRKSPLANYVMGSIALGKDDLRSAEVYLRRAADADKPIDLAINDLAETYRRQERYDLAVEYGEKAVATNPKLYVARETLASALMAAGKDLPRALTLMNEAVELSKVDGRVEDSRMYVGLARAQLLNGDVKGARVSLRKMKSQVDKLSDFEKKEYEELLKRVR